MRRTRNFEVWCVDPLDATEDDSKTIRAMDPQQAAQEWARWHDPDSADYPIVGGETYRVCVRDSASMEVTTWSVTGYSEPVYCARAVS